jgi:hypothetical protein
VWCGWQILADDVVSTDQETFHDVSQWTASALMLLISLQLFCFVLFYFTTTINILSILV